METLKKPSMGLLRMLNLGCEVKKPWKKNGMKKAKKEPKTKNGKKKNGKHTQKRKFPFLLFCTNNLTAVVFFRD